MPVELTLRLDDRQVAFLARELRERPAAWDRIYESAVRRTTRWTRTRLGRVIRQRLNLPAARVLKGLKMTVVGARGRRVMEKRAYGLIEVSGRPPTLMSYGAKERRSRGRRAAGGGKGRALGVAVKVRRDQAPQLLRHAFIAPGRGHSAEASNLQVFERAGGVTRSGKPRLKALYGPSFARHLEAGAGKVELAALQEAGASRLLVEVRGQIDRWNARQQARQPRRLAGRG